MSTQNSPNAAKRPVPAPRETTPRSSLRTNILRTPILNRIQALNAQPSQPRSTGSTMNTAFSSASKTTNARPSAWSAFNKTKSHSSTSLNACYTPSSLYRPSVKTKSSPSPALRSISSTPNTPMLRKQKLFEAKTPLASDAKGDGSMLNSTTPGKSVRDSCGEISNLTVAVRVRPMNAKELTLPSISNVIRVESSNDVTVVAGSTADSSAGVCHSFQYDRAFWSCNSEHANYADQTSVFEGTALPLLQKAFEGYNACLFAYGQTGSGKSYSMMGIDSDKDMDRISDHSDAGIIPRFCEELFRRIDRISDTTHAEVEVSYFEIYNEKIHDLLAVSPQTGVVNTASLGANTKKAALRVREHPVWGPYIVDLSTHPVDNHTALRNWLAVGNLQRATAATGMNDKSSRSHSIFNIVLNLSEKVASGEAGHQTKRSKISLVDLAGSERVSHTCAVGERLREGVSINKSLLTLGKVIAALADTKKGASATFVPYRESVLTWLLRESLGGNSRTVMLATISPASIHLDETLATLRYACQARTIVNRVKVNEDPHDRIIRELRAEVDRLQTLRQDYERQHMHSHVVAQQPRKIIIESAAVRTPPKSPASKTCASSVEREVESLRQQLADTEEELARAQRSWCDRLREADEVRHSEMRLLKRRGLALELSAADQQHPCLVNLAADPIWSGTLLYLLPPGEVIVGRAAACADIVLDSPLVADRHCTIENCDEGQSLFVTSEGDECETFVNGNAVVHGAACPLFHGDRLAIGGSHFFRVLNSRCTHATAESRHEKPVDYQTAYQEVLRKQEQRLREELNAEKEAALAEIESERFISAMQYKEKLASLELERFKYACSKEILDSEQLVETAANHRPSIDYRPAYKSTLLDDIKRIMEHPSAENLHKTQLNVKEATQRCRDRSLNYEFKQSQVADEFGIFRSVVTIMDRDRCRTAEWPPARLDIWLAAMRDNELPTERLFANVDIEWRPANRDELDDSLTNVSAQCSRRISLNVSAMKDAMRKSLRHNDVVAPIKREPLAPRRNTPQNGFRTNAKSYLGEIERALLNLKELCEKEEAADQEKENYLQQFCKIETIVDKVRSKMDGMTDEADACAAADRLKSKTVRFQFD